MARKGRVQEYEIRKTKEANKRWASGERDEAKKKQKRGARVYNKSYEANSGKVALGPT